MDRKGATAKLKRKDWGRDADPKLILNLQEFWSKNGCLIGLPYDIEKGAGTMNPLTFFGALGPDSWRVAYAEPSRRPADGRYGDNPFRVYKHLQFQVLLKPSPPMSKTFI